MNATAKAEGRRTTEVMRTPMRSQSECVAPASSDTGKVMPSAARATKLFLLEGDDLSQLLTLDRQYEAMWREYQSVTGDHLPTWEAAKRNYDVAEHQLAEHVHQLLQRAAKPALVLADQCSCGNTK